MACGWVTENVYLAIKGAGGGEKLVVFGEQWRSQSSFEYMFECTVQHCQLHLLNQNMAILRDRDELNMRQEWLAAAWLE